MFLFFFFFFQRVLVAGFQSKLSWSLLSCYCGHCWLLPRLLFVAAPSAALVLLQRPWLLQWVLFLATLRALLLTASAVLFSANPLGALVCCVNWGTFLPASEDAPTMAASWAAAFT